MLVGWWGRGEGKRERDVKRGEKRGKEKVKRCRIMRVSVWECNFIEHKYKWDRRDYIFFYNRVFTTQSHIETPLSTHKSFDTKRYTHLSINLYLVLFVRAAVTFKEKFLSSRTKSHLQQAVILWIDINKALSGNINPLCTLFHPSPVFMVSVILFLLVKVFFQTTNLCQTHFGKHFTWRAAFWKVFIFGLFSFLCLHSFFEPKQFLPGVDNNILILSSFPSV